MPCPNRTSSCGFPAEGPSRRARLSAFGESVPRIRCILRCSIVAAPGGGIDGIVIRSLGVVDAFSRSRASRVPTCRRHQVGRSSISRPFEQAAVVFSPIGASVLVHNVAVRFGAHDGIQSDIAPTPKSAIQRHSKVSAPDLFWRHRTEMAHPREQADRAASARRRSAASFRRTKIASEYPAAINRPNEIMLSTPEILWISAPTA